MSSGGFRSRPKKQRALSIGRSFQPAEGERFQSRPDGFLRRWADDNRDFHERGESGIRNILNPATSGNHPAASEDTRVRTAAGTSPLISRSIAFVCPALSRTSAAPAVVIALRSVSLDADCRSSIATSLPARSDTDLISGRAIKSATRWSVLSLGTDAVSARPEASALFASLCVPKTLSELMP
jgi:hypothetical protein